MKFKEFYNTPKTDYIKEIGKISKQKDDSLILKVDGYDMDVKTAKVIMDAYKTLPEEKKKIVRHLPIGKITDMAWQKRSFRVD